MTAPQAALPVPSLPTGWRIGRLKETVASAKNGVWGDEPDGSAADIPCVRVADFDRLAFEAGVAPTIRSVSSSQRRGRVLGAGDLLLEKSGGGEKQPVGCVVIYVGEDPAVCSNFVARLEVAPPHHPRFLTYLHAALYSAGISARNIKQTTGIQNLDASAYFNERVPLPPAGTQRAIADLLDRKTAAIDALIEKKERLIALLEEKRQALITQAVTKGLDPNVPMKDSGIEWLGEIPAHWELAQLGWGLSFISYGFTSPMPTTDEGPYMLTANDIGDGVVHYESARRTDESSCAQLTRKCRPQAGDILITKDGTLGRVAVADGRPCCINQSVAVLTVNGRYGTTDFVQNALRAEAYQARMMFEAGGTTIKHIYITRLAKMPIAYPPRDEQEQICAYVNEARAQHDALLDAARQSVGLLREYRQAVITAAVTGKLDVTSEEAA